MRNAAIGKNLLCLHYVGQSEVAQWLARATDRNPLQINTLLSSNNCCIRIPYILMNKLK